MTQHFADEERVSIGLEKDVVSQMHERFIKWVTDSGL
jgi:hypothetical protein